jgi:hypothetical protein
MIWVLYTLDLPTSTSSKPRHHLRDTSEVTSSIPSYPRGDFICLEARSVPLEDITMARDQFPHKVFVLLTCGSQAYHMTTRVFYANQRTTRVQHALVQWAATPPINTPKVSTSKVTKIHWITLLSRIISHYTYTNLGILLESGSVHSLIYICHL